MTDTAEAIRTDWPANTVRAGGGYFTSERAAIEAREKRAMQIAINRDINQRHGRSPQYLKPDGLQQLRDEGHLNDDHFRAGQRYQRAFERRLGSIRSPLNLEPPGDQSDALDGNIDAGRIVSRFHDCASTDAELRALVLVCGCGMTARKVDSKPKRVVDRLIKVLDAAIKARA